MMIIIIIVVFVDSGEKIKFTALVPYALARCMLCVCVCIFSGGSLSLALIE
jgi:hypothetical protein